MTPLAGDGIGSAQQTPADGDATADTRAEDHGEDVRRTRRRAIPCLRHGEAVGVIGQVDLVPQHGLEVLLEGPAVETGGIGVLEEAGGRRDRARMTDTDRQVLAPDGLLLAAAPLPRSSPASPGNRPVASPRARARRGASARP